MGGAKDWEAQQREHKAQWDRWNKICPRDLRMPLSRNTSLANSRSVLSMTSSLAVVH